MRFLQEQANLEIKKTSKSYWDESRITMAIDYRICSNYVDIAPFNTPNFLLLPLRGNLWLNPIFEIVLSPGIYVLKIPGSEKRGWELEKISN